jgi:hypothetical protein
MSVTIGYGRAGLFLVTLGWLLLYYASSMFVPKPTPREEEKLKETSKKEYLLKKDWYLESIVGTRVDLDEDEEGEHNHEGKHNEKEKSEKANDESG